MGLTKTKLGTRLAGALPTVVVAVSFAAFTAMCLRLAWNPPVATYLDYVPIAAVFAARRLTSRSSSPGRLAPLLHDSRRWIAELLQHRLDGPMPFSHSARNAITGSTPAARRAGR
jgi:hypothetical protein